MAEDAWSVVLVDDDEDTRAVLRMGLERARFRVVGEGADGRTAEELVVEHQPHVVVVDLGLPDLADEELIPRLVVAAPQTMVAVLTGRTAEDREAATLASGAFTFYEKSMMGAGLVDYLVADRQLFDRALDGEEVVAPSAINRRAMA